MYTRDLARQRTSDCTSFFYSLSLSLHFVGCFSFEFFQLWSAMVI